MAYNFCSLLLPALTSACLQSFSNKVTSKATSLLFVVLVIVHVSLAPCFCACPYWCVSVGSVTKIGLLSICTNLGRGFTSRKNANPPSPPTHPPLYHAPTYRIHCWLYTMKIISDRSKAGLLLWFLSFTCFCCPFRCFCLPVVWVWFQIRSLHKDLSGKELLFPFRCQPSMII